MTWTERSNCLLAETPVLLRRNSTAISVKLPLSLRHNLSYLTPKCHHIKH